MALADTEATDPVEAVPQTTVPGSAMTRLFRFATWVHVGPDAEGCEDAENGACANPLHFHAWCRLPNPFQQKDIRGKALAAKARKVRQLRDESTDGYVILEEEMEELARLGEQVRPELVDELLAKDWYDTYFAAQRDVGDQADDDTGEALWEHVDADRERLAVLEAKLKDGAEPDDELAELRKHLDAHASACAARFDELQQPMKDALEARDISDLIDLVRDQRIDVESQKEFLDEYSTQEWLACTYIKPPTRTESAVPVWSSYEHMAEAPSEALLEVKSVFEDLERTEREASQGNS